MGGVVAEPVEPCHRNPVIGLERRVECLSSKFGQLERAFLRWAAERHSTVWPSRRFEPVAVARYHDALVEALPRAPGAAGTGTTLGCPRAAAR